VLAGLDRSALAGPDLLVLARARARQLAHDQAQLQADVLEIASVAVDSLDETDLIVCGDRVADFADDEVAAALSWTSVTAAHQIELAEQCIRRLPAVHAAMLGGHIDVAKARVLCQGVRVLEDDALARALVERVLTGAEQKTTAQLRAKLARLVIKTDPDAARRRYSNGLGLRRLEHGREDDGTWCLGGRFLPAPAATEAYARINGLATAWKQAGDRRSLDQLRADLFLDVLTGRSLATPPAPIDRDPAEQPGPAEQPDPADPDGGNAAPAGICPTCGGVPGRGGLELTVPLRTLMGLADDPGELGHWGPVIADVARRAAADLAHAPWRLSVTDGNGTVIWHGPTRRRPTAEHAAYVRARDRLCRFPTCRRTARRAQIDHSTDYQHGGPTIPPNLGCLCAKHHRLKTLGHWKLMQLHDGVFVWRSKLGRTYLVEPEPADDP
jgi:hypothetical protein